jgi:hypothetical protein
MVTPILGPILGGARANVSHPPPPPVSALVEIARTILVPQPAGPSGVSFRMGTGLQGKVIIVTGEIILVDGAACVKF